MEEICGLEVTSTPVSRLTAHLDESLEKWRNRPLPEISHLSLDATYIKVRVDSSVRDCALLAGIGVRRVNSKRMILGVSIALSETEVHWLTSDAHEGLKAALRATLNTSPWQRCQCHLQQNAQTYIPKVSMRKQVCETLNSQIKRRTRVAGLFPNEASILRLVSAILMDISEEWESGKTYLPQINKKTLAFFSQPHRIYRKIVPSPDSPAELTTTGKAGALEEEQEKVGPKGETSGSERVKGHREHDEWLRIGSDLFVRDAAF